MGMAKTDRDLECSVFLATNTQPHSLRVEDAPETFERPFPATAMQEACGVQPSQIVLITVFFPQSQVCTRTLEKQPLRISFSPRKVKPLRPHLQIKDTSVWHFLTIGASC